MPDRRYRLAAAVLIVAVLIAFFEILGTDHALLLRDHQFVFWPRWWAIRDSWLHGELPALTVGGQAGVPIDQLLNGTYTPGALLLLLGPFEFVYDLFVAAHFMILGIGGLLLARRFGAPAAAALAASAVLMLAGPTISTESLVVNLIGFAYTPWVLLGWHAVLTNPSRASAALFAIPLGFQLQSIIPPVLLLDIVGGLTIALYVRRRVTPAMVGATVLGIVLGLGIASLELFGALEGLVGTGRGGGFAYNVSSGWAVSPAAMLEYFVPAFWAPPDLPFLNPGDITLNRTDPPYFSSLYLGTAIPIALLGATTKRGRLLLVPLLFFGIVAMGRFTPLHAVVASLPILQSSRYAVKYTMLVVAAVSALAGVGIATASALPKRLRAFASVHVAAAVVLLLIQFLDRWRDLLSRLHAFGAERWGLPLDGVVAIAQSIGIHRAVHALVAGLILWVVAHLMCRRNDPRLPMIAAVVLTLDLAVAGSYVVVGSNIEKTTMPSAFVDVLKKETAPTRYFAETATTAVRVDLHDPAKVQETVLRGYAERGDILLPGTRRFQDLQLDALSHPFHAAMSRLAHLMPSEPRNALLARVGVTHILSPVAGQPFEVAASIEREGGGTIFMYTVDATPYVHGYTRWQSINAGSWPSTRYEAFFRDPANANVGLVDGGPASETATTCGGRPNIEWVSAGPNGPIDATVESPCRSVLVLEEIARRGWVVTVDDEVAPVFAVDAGYVGVEVPAGRHDVRFTYDALVRQWMPISLISLLAAVLLWFRGRSSTPRRD